MAWRSHGTTNASLVAALERNGIVTKPRVREAMLATDRAPFCLRGGRPYEDAPQVIGYGATISAPHMHAHCLELLEEKIPVGGSVLDVGSGSGYLAAALSHMVGPAGKVVGVEHIAELVEDSKRAVKKLNPDLLSSGRVTLVAGDGRLGYPAMQPYNAIHVGAASPETPHALIDQLAPGGRMVVPVGAADGDQALVQYDKADDGTVTRKMLMGVRYVPLSDRDDPHYAPQR